jgi:hypothetical protein
MGIAGGNIVSRVLETGGKAVEEGLVGSLAGGLLAGEPLAEGRCVSGSSASGLWGG